MKQYTFEAEIQAQEGMNAAYVIFPYSVEEEFGVRGQVKVKAIFDDHVEYRGSLARMLRDEHCLGMTQQIRAALNKSPGERVKVSLIQDVEPRIVEVPEVLLAALQANALMEKFERLSYTNRKEMARTVTEAKKEETRERRINKIIEQLSK